MQFSTNWIFVSTTLEQLSFREDVWIYYLILLREQRLFTMKEEVPFENHFAEDWRIQNLQRPVTSEILEL